MFVNISFITFYLNQNQFFHYISNKVIHFTVQVEHEFISYVHDGGETTEDNFTLVANDTEVRKQSMPQVIHVNVMPVNDEPPVITANRILRVRQASGPSDTLTDH